MTEPNQTDMAEAISDYMNVTVLEEDETTLVDILDALASTGLKLALDTNGDATIAYTLALSPEE